MNDKIKVPHEYLPTLRRMRDGSIIPSDLDKVDEFIAAAEADRPPLPEGWVTETRPDGSSRTVWHKDGVTSLWSNGDGETITGHGSRLTPLRPTVTAAELHRAWMFLDDAGAILDRDDLGTALGQIGIEVRP